jgi:hypoxanthine phosphoribosyltransferase
MKKVFLSWEDIDSSMSVIVDQIKRSTFSPTSLLCIGRGGMIPGRILSDRLSITEISIIDAKMYTGIGTRTDVPKIGSVSLNVRHKNVILVDDIVDTGITMDAVYEKVNQQGPVNIKAATVVVKEHVKRLPSYFDRKAKEDEWIVFPWESEEFKS